MSELRIIIAGSRDFSDYNLLKSSVSKIIQDSEKTQVTIVSGTARGADRLGEQFAKENRYQIAYFPANWDGFGKSAGYIRNKEMANFAVSEDATGMLIAFWDRKSKGTKHMIDLANKSGLIVYIVDF